MKILKVISAVIGFIFLAVAVATLLLGIIAVLPVAIVACLIGLGGIAFVFMAEGIDQT